MSRDVRADETAEDVEECRGEAFIFWDPFALFARAFFLYGGGGEEGGSGIIVNFLRSRFCGWAAQDRESWLAADERR